MTTDATPKCQYCGEPFHKGVCPRVKMIHYAENGYTIEAVELTPFVALPQGCICPPSSEATCQGPWCPRRKVVIG